MSLPDGVLIAWWLLAAAVGIPMFILTWRSDLLDRQRAVLSHLMGIPLGRYPTWQGVRMPEPLQIAVLVSSVLLAIGALLLIFIHDWTRLLVFNAQIFMVMFGGGVAMIGLSSRVFANARPEDGQPAHRFMRPVFVLFGAAIVAVGGLAAIEDIALPRRVVEGHVDSVNIYQRRLVDSEYIVVIDSERLRSTFEAFVHIHPNRKVRVEVGAGSGMIFAADDNTHRAVSGPRRN